MKIVSDFMMEPKRAPELLQKWHQNEPKMGPEMSPESAPKWDRMRSLKSSKTLCFLAFLLKREARIEVNVSQAKDYKATEMHVLTLSLHFEHLQHYGVVSSFLVFCALITF